MKPIVSITLTHRPEFYDIDPMNIVWHGNYMKYFEKARARLLAEIGYGYEAMLAGGHGWPVVDTRIRYYRPLKFSQEFEITAGITEWENRLRIVYEIRDAATGERLTRGYSVQVAVDRHTEEMLWETPDILRERLAPYLPGS